MVKEIKKENKIYYQCESCDMYYPKKELAKKCEDFCDNHKACNTEIIKHSINLK